MANLPLSIRVQRTLLASMCRAIPMPFSARALKKNIFIDVDFVVRQQAVPAAMRFVYARACLSLVFRYGRPSFPNSLGRIKAATVYFAVAFSSL